MKAIPTILLAVILSAAINDSGKVLATLTGSCNELVNQSAKKAAKAGAQGVIIDLATNKWTAIKYR